MNILIADPIDPTGIEYLIDNGGAVKYRPDISMEELFRQIDKYEVLVVRSRTKVTRELLQKALRLKLIARAGSGVDNIDLIAARQCGITVINAPGANSNAAAEHTLALMLALLRAIPQAHMAIAKGDWPKKKLSGGEIRGKTVGIIGYGRVGHIVAAICRALGAVVLTHDQSDSAPNLKQLLQNADIITLHTALTDETRNLIDKQKFVWMKDGAYLINTARAELVVERDLYDALESGKLGGAALDVFWQEPLTLASKLHKFNQVVLTCHIAGQTVESSRSAALMVATDIIRFKNGQEAIHRVV